MTHHKVVEPKLPTLISRSVVELICVLKQPRHISVTSKYKMCRVEGTNDAFVPHFEGKMPELPQTYTTNMMAQELVTAIQRCAIGDKEQLQAAAELAAIFIAELTELLVQRPQLQPQIFRQVLPAVQNFLDRSKIISAADTGAVLRNANRLLGAAAQFVGVGEHTVILSAGCFKEAYCCNFCISSASIGPSCRLNSVQGHCACPCLMHAAASAAHRPAGYLRLFSLPHAAAEQHALLLKDEGALEMAAACMAALFNEGRPGMLLEGAIVQAQRALISIMLELAEFSGCAACRPCCLHVLV